MDRLVARYRGFCARLVLSRLSASLQNTVSRLGTALLQALLFRKPPQRQLRRASRPARNWPYRMLSWGGVALIAVGMLGIGRMGFAGDGKYASFDGMIARHAQANDIPESLIRRVIWRESKYNPRLIGRGHAMGLMQIKPATAREVGYSGSAEGLLDAETNMKYATRYLAGAYRVAGGNMDRAVALYAKGYYFEAKRRGMLATMYKFRNVPDEAPVREAAAVPTAVPEKPPAQKQSFQLASAEPVMHDAPARPQSRLARETAAAREAARAEEPLRQAKSDLHTASIRNAAAEREPVRVSAAAVPMPRDKPARVAMASRDLVPLREAAVRQSLPTREALPMRYAMPPREAITAQQLAAARQVAAIQPDSFATGDLFVPHATPVIAEMAPRYTNAAVRTLSDAPVRHNVIDQNKIAAVEAPRAVDPAPVPQQPRIEAVAKPASEPQPLATPQPLPAAIPAAIPQPETRAVAVPAAVPTQPAQENLAAASRKIEDVKPAKREREATRPAARVRAQNAAPAPLRWLEQQFASLGRALSGPQQRQPRRAPAQ